MHKISGQFAKRLSLMMKMTSGKSSKRDWKVNYWFPSVQLISKQLQDRTWFGLQRTSNQLEATENRHLKFSSFIYLLTCQKHNKMSKLERGYILEVQLQCLHKGPNLCWSNFVGWFRQLGSGRTTEGERSGLQPWVSLWAKCWTNCSETSRWES
jgi:hypothetical protein